MRTAEEKKRWQAAIMADEGRVKASFAALGHQQKIAERRDEILKLVQTGQMGSLMADQIVEEERLYPLSTNPSVNSVNIFRLPLWTIEMVLAWVLRRHREDVLLFHDPFRTNIIAWKPLFAGDELCGYDLAHEEPATIAAFDIHAASSIDHDADERSEVAKVKLWSALETGRIRAAAYDMLQKSVVTIPDIEWSYLIFSDIEGTPAKLRFKSSDENRYCNIKFKSADVLAIWEPLGDQTEPLLFSPYPHSIYELVDRVGPDGRSVFAPPMNVEEPLIDCDGQEVPKGTNANQTGAPNKKLSPMEQEIHRAIPILWKDGQHPIVPMEFQKKVNDYLKFERNLTKLPGPKTYQRYFRNIRNG